MVAAIISAMVNDSQFSKAIKEKIGTSVDTEDLEKQLAALQAQLRQTLGIKTRLERQMDTMDINDPHFDRKILDLQRRYDEQYGRIEEIEAQMDEVKSQIQSIRQKKISGDNIYQLLLMFDEVYGAATEFEQKEFMQAFIERIDLYPEKQEDGNWIRNIVFNFPVPVNGQEVKELPLETGTTLETVVLLSKLNTKQHIEVELNLDELDLTAAESKATYDEIKAYVLEKYGLKVSSLYISQVKRKCGLDVGQNYNLSKKEDAKVPQCPPEKEAAIMDALKHFQMYTVNH